MKKYLPRVLLAAPASGGGKTTLTCGLLQAAIDGGMKPAAFKCGPDYIDPMFHREITGASTSNLDLYFTSESTARSLLAKYSEGRDIALLEGVMGYYDGVGIESTQASSYHLAQATSTPVVLVIDGKGAALSLVATLHGFASFRPDANIKGVILNRCTKGLFDIISPAVEELGIAALGYVPDDKAYAVGSRHLGLVTASEVEGLRQMIAGLASAMAKTIDLPRLWGIAESAPPLEYEPYETARICDNRPRLAIAKDLAFCFYYRENLDMLTDMGAELVEFSPMDDENLPDCIHGLYMGGGYPELYANRLSNNKSMLESVRDAVNGGLPTVAECGGYMYLQQHITDGDNWVWPMAGVLDGICQNEGRLKQFGYIELTANQDNLYCKQGGRTAAHEFHYWHSDHAGGVFSARKPGRDTGWTCMEAKGNLIAGYPHIYYPANPEFAASFVRAMAEYKDD